MTNSDDFVQAALRTLDPKPTDAASQAEKRRYSERVSNVLAPAFAAELVRRGMKGARPDEPGGAAGLSGAERRMAGGIGAKKVDVTWATEESGLLLALSIKTFNFRDQRSGNFQKNLTNRRGDMLYEAVTLHRRFPFAVLGGFIIFDKDAATDDTDKRRSTFLNTHTAMAMFDGREEPSGPDEQYERLYVGLLDITPSTVACDFYRVENPNDPVPIDAIFTDLVELVAERNSDFYAVAPDGMAIKHA